MKSFKAAGWLGVLLLSGVQPASALEQIPVECVVELVKNDIVEQKFSGPCGYGKPLVVRPSASAGVGNAASSGGTAAELQLQSVKDAAVAIPGLYAKVYLGHNLSDQNPMANVSIEYVLVTARGVQKLPTVNENNGTTDLYMPIVSKDFGDGNRLFRKGEVGQVSGWMDGPDTYQIRIGLR